MTGVAEKQNIRNLSKTELLDALDQLGQPKFRAEQVYKWIWEKGVRNFADMRNVPNSLKEKLSERFGFQSLSIDAEQRSADGTIKLRFKTDDGHLIEGVLIPTDDRMTACVSSQVGCSLACKFCATGFLKRERNLRADEIFDQVMLINEICQQTYNQNLTNIVYMGMGEPLLNYKEVVDSVRLISKPDGFAFSPRRITISTAGIEKAIRRLAEEGLKTKLALSLHAANDQKRNKIMAINETNNLAALKSALAFHIEKVKRRVSLEYIAFNGFNDGPEDALELAKFVKGLLAHVNIIEYNAVDGVDFEKSSGNRLNEFARILKGKGVEVTIRRSRGKDIDAACGQLANK